MILSTIFEKNSDKQFLKKRLAERLQAGLPFTPFPWRKIAEELNCEETTALRLTDDMIQEGLIRSFGAFLDFEKMGYEGFLCGLVVPEGDIPSVAARIASPSRQEVTHSYIRGHEVNLWCTALLKGPTAKKRFLEDLRLTGCPSVALRTTTRLKLKPVFRLSDAPETNTKRDFEALDSDESGLHEKIINEKTIQGEKITAGDSTVLASLQTRFPVTARPFAEAARRAGTTENALLERLKRLKRTGVLRRIGASLDHRRLGCEANALVAWDVGNRESAGREAGEKASRFPWVSHCYLRESVTNTLSFSWPYRLYTMVHAHAPALLGKHLLNMRTALAPRSFVVLPTVRELKKTRYLLWSLPAPEQFVKG